MSTYHSQRFNRVADNLYRSGEGTYYARARFKGKNYKASLQTTDRQVAARKLKDYLVQIEQGEKLQPDVTFAEAAAKWMVTQYNLKPMSLLRREVCLKAILPSFGDMMLRDITKEGVDTWAGRRSKQVSPRTFNYDKDTFILVFEYAKSLNIVKDSPVKMIKKMKTKKPVVIPPTREEFKTLVNLIAKSPSKEGADFITFLGYSGKLKLFN